MAIWYKPWTWGVPRTFTHYTTSEELGPWQMQWVCPECGQDRTNNVVESFEGVVYRITPHPPLTNEPCQECGSPKESTRTSYRVKTLTTTHHHLDGWTKTVTSTQYLYRDTQ